MISFRDQNTFVTIIYIFRLERCFNFLARSKTKINKAYIHKKPCVNLLTNETYILQYHFLHRFNCSNSFNNSLKCKLPEYLRSTCRISPAVAVLTRTIFFSPEKEEEKEERKREEDREGLFSSSTVNCRGTCAHRRWRTVSFKFWTNVL